MCWLGKNTDIRVSNEDTKVYKVVYTTPKGWHDLDKNVKRSYLAPFFHFIYYLNIPYTSEIVGYSIPSPTRVAYITKSIDKAIHCYSSLCEWDTTDGYYLRIIESSGHNTLCRYQLKNTKNHDNLVVAVVEGIIPSGTEYWENNRGEIATSKLILKQVRYMYNGN